MDKEGFRIYLKKEGKSQRIINATIEHAEEFEHYLVEQRRGKKLDEACCEDLDTFICWIEQDKALTAKKYMLSIRYLYEFIPNNEMANHAAFRWNERIVDSASSFKLKGFRGVETNDLVKLGHAGIRNVSDVMKACRTSADRNSVAAKTGVAVDRILELVKLCDLTRIQGVKGIRARLYYDAGVDTIEEIAKWNPTELRTYLVGFVRKTGFRGIAPLPKELKFTIETARRIPKIIEY